jgi:hypothetical protein
MYEAKGFQNTDFAELVNEVNIYLGELEDGKLIDVKYNTVPLAVSSHTEYGVYPDSNYTSIVITMKY